jgi:glyoxylase-like metal-dependent hydrolase (beta-lactamase superfamily II)
MKKIFWVLALGAVASMAMAAGLSRAAPAGGVSLTRLDCGTIRANDLDAFSDTRAFVGRKMEITDSCYLIRHGDQIMLWNAGLPASAKGARLNDTDTFSMSLNKTLVEQLAQLGIKPEQVTLLGLSHYHFDHTGQASFFPGARLMIGAADWQAVRGKPTPFGASPGDLAPWAKGGKVEPVSGDKDVFGDGSVVMLAMPGHTPGHHALLVRLAGKGPVLLSGDTTHFLENYDRYGVPGFNTDRAQSLASQSRLREMTSNLNATLIIEHDPADIAKLPAFPEAAR